jgi:hypothetical protein
MNERWLIAGYNPVSLFSLRMSAATSWAARTNIAPTPYAVKMALIDAAFRVEGQELTRRVFERIGKCEIRFRLPERVVLNGTLVKVLREPKDKKKSPNTYISSVAYREFVFFSDSFKVAIFTGNYSTEDEKIVSNLFHHINYFGKRGSFCICTGVEILEAKLPGSFSFSMEAKVDTLASDIIIQHLDDFGPGVTFDKINTYSEATMKPGRDRVFVPTVFPYRLINTGQGFSLYVRASCLPEGPPALESNF